MDRDRLRDYVSYLQDVVEDLDVILERMQVRDVILDGLDTDSYEDVTAAYLKLAELLQHRTSQLTATAQAGNAER